MACQPGLEFWRSRPENWNIDAKKNPPSALMNIRIRKYLPYSQWGIEVCMKWWVDNKKWRRWRIRSTATGWGRNVRLPAAWAETHNSLNETDEARQCYCCSFYCLILMMISDWLIKGEGGGVFILSCRTKTDSRAREHNSWLDSSPEYCLYK